MTDPIYRIVVGNDFSETAHLALENAFDLAAKESNAEVHVIHAVQYLGELVQMDLPGTPAYRLPLEEAQKKLQTDVSERLADWQKRTGHEFSRCVTHIGTDYPATAVAQLATDLEAEIIVVGTHGRRGFSRFMLGSIAEAVVRLAHVPVLVVRPKHEDEPGPVIAKACPKCVDVRKETKGKQLWCEQHGEKHGRRHTYHFGERISKDGSIGMM